MKRALLLGIDHYDRFKDLSGCANDAASLHPFLARNEDDSPNLDCRVLVARDAGTRVTRDELLSLVDELLAPGCDFSLLYFAGHGAPAGGDVAIVTSDGTEQTPGVAFAEIIEKIGRSTVSEIVVVLDCCFSGGATTLGALGNQLANLRPGLSVLTASRDDQVSMETEAGRGQFSTYLEGALDGGAADVLGGATRWISPSKAIVQLSNRGKRNDKFWFAFFHELGHVLLHGKREVFVEDKIGFDGGRLEQEAEANEFAGSLLIPHDVEAELAHIRDNDDVVVFADKLGITPGVVAGRLQHDREDYRFGHGLFQKFEIVELDD